MPTREVADQENTQLNTRATAAHAVPAAAPLDLVAEHLQCDSLTPKAVRWLLRQGIPPTAILAGDVPMLCAEVTFAGKRFEFARHRPSDDVVTAFVLPVFDQWGDNTDLAAWHPTEGVALWLGNVAMLGEEQVQQPRLGEPLEVHATVLAWLRSNRQGVVVLHQSRALPMLRAAAPLLVDDTHFAAKLHDALTIKAPQILVRAA